MNRAKMLLKYKTYLLYRVDINIESKKGFKAVMYLLENANKMPTDFFSSVDIYLTKD